MFKSRPGKLCVYPMKRGFKMRMIALFTVLAVAGCVQSQFGLGVDLGTGDVSPSFTGTSGNASISIGG